MKKSLNRLRFSFRFSYKNMMHHPFRAFLLLIGFLGLFISLMLGVSMNDFFHAYYTGRLVERYQETDLVMSISQTSDTRFFRTSSLSDSSLDSIINDYASFFEVDVLLETEEDEKLYVHIYSSTLNQFRKISNLDSSINSLNSDEIIITKEFADAYALEISDTITLYAGNESRVFNVRHIVSDGQLFSGYSVYLNKDISLPFFLSSISPSLADLPPQLLVNIHNKVYIDIKDDISHEEAISVLKSITDYESLDYQITIDQEAINQFVKRNVSVFSMVISMVIIAILLVMQTTLLVYFEDKKKTFASIQIIGGSKNFSFLIISIEMIFYLMISFLLGVFLTNQIIAYGLDFMSSPITFKLSLLQIFISLSLIAVLTFLMIIYYFHRYQKQSSIAHTKDENSSYIFPVKWVLLLFIISLSIYILLLIPSSSAVAAFIQVLISFIVLLTLGLLLLMVFIKLSKRFKKQHVFGFHLQMMLSKKVFYQYIFVMLVSFLSIFMLILANDYMEIRTSTYEDEYNIDLIVTNIINDFDQSYLEISALEQVLVADKVGLYQDIYIEDYDQSINELISIDPELIDRYYQLNITETEKQSLKSYDVLAILLPDRFQLLYSLDIGDSIMISFGSSFDHEPFIIAGFFEKQVGNLAFTNLYQLPSYEDIKYNAIFVNAKENKTILQYELWDLYSQKMIVIYDHDLVVNTLVDEMRNISEYITYIISIIILCFVLSIINHSSLLLSQMQANYARLHVLGISKRKMRKILTIESIFLFVLLWFSATLSYVLIAVRLNRFVLFFGEYEPISLTLSSIYLGSIFVLVLFIITKSIYIFNLSKIKTSEIIRTYS